MSPLLTAAVQRVLSVARKELRQLSRDRLTMGFIVGVPAIQLLLFGYAINQDVRHVPTAVVDRADSEVSRRLVGQLVATQTLEIAAQPSSEAEGRVLLRRGKVGALVVIPADFSRAYYRGRGAEISVLVDATDPTSARAIRASVKGLMEQLDQRLERFDTSSGRAGGGALRAPRDRASFGAQPELIHDRFLRFTVLTLFNPELRTATFVVPALLGVILTTTMILMTALAIVRERERGTFEFLIATPVRSAELMAGKILPYIGIGLIQVAIVLAAGLMLFRVPIEGRLLDLGIASVVFIAANLTLGLVISAKTATQFQATQISFMFFLPSVLLSGFMFPFHAMPRPAQWLGELLPLTHFVRLCRGILLRGAGLGDLAGEVAAMALFAIVGFAIATRIFTKRLG